MVILPPLAPGLPLPRLRRTRALAIQARSDDLLPVPGVPASDHVDRGHPVRGHEAAAAHLDAGDAPADLDQDQPGGAGADAPSGRELQDRLAREAQDHAGHGRTGRGQETRGLRAARRRLPGRRAQRGQARAWIREQAGVRDRGADGRPARTPDLRRDRPGPQPRQRLAQRLDRAPPGTRVRGLQRRPGLLPQA